jgi:hypothetical protein
MPKLMCKFVCGCFFLAAFAQPQNAMGATTAPGVGIYSVSTYVASAIATNGGNCGAPRGDYLSSYFYYPGPARMGATERHSINGSQGNFIQELEFPATPAANTITWSGSYTSIRYPSEVSSSGTFSTVFTFIDNNSFLATTTYMYSGGSNSTCTTVFQNTYIRVGDIPRNHAAE